MTVRDLFLRQRNCTTIDFTLSILKSKGVRVKRLVLRNIIRTLSIKKISVTHKLDNAYFTLIVL